LCQHIFTVGENDLLQAKRRSCTFVGHVTAEPREWSKGLAIAFRLFLQTLSLVDENRKNTSNIVQIYFMLNNLYKQRGILQLVFPGHLKNAVSLCNALSDH
jgi:hypothetical protein